MITLIKSSIVKQAFFPNWLGIIINPFYFARLNLAKSISKYSLHLNGKLIDVGCGTKPYQALFRVEKYTGLDIDDEQNRQLGIADYFYDGNSFPFPSDEFDSALCNQVLEHVFNPNEFLSEIFRIMKPGSKLLLTVPFVWDEHSQPFDYGRYTSFGLKHLLKQNGFKILKHEKLGSDITVIVQLVNAYLFKVSLNWNKYFRKLFTYSIMSLVNLIGLILKYILPQNNDLYLDHIVLAEK